MGKIFMDAKILDCSLTFMSTYFVVFFPTTKTTNFLPLEKYQLYGTNCIVHMYMSTMEQRGLGHSREQRGLGHSREQRGLGHSGSKGD